MNTLRLNYYKIDVERMLITLGITLMEVSGFVLLICGLFDIKII